MARFAYFIDQPDGSVIEFRERVEYYDQGIYRRTRIVAPKVGLYIPNEEPNCNGNVLCGYVPGRGMVRITRKIELKSMPSRHECDARCMYAKGRSMACECACGGKNHGRGGFVCEAA